MDKISGIIPSSARVTSVDMSNSPGVRATLPNSVDKGVGAMSHISESIPGSPGWKTREARQASLAAEVSNNFFMKVKPEAEAASASAAKEIPAAQIQSSQPDGLFPKGSFIDRSA